MFKINPFTNMKVFLRNTLSIFCPVPSRYAAQNEFRLAVKSISY